MTYHYERQDIAVNPEQLERLFCKLARRQYDHPWYIAARCYVFEVGPPMSNGKSAHWYEDFDPDQLYFPFRAFIPVEMEELYADNNGWVLQCLSPNSRPLTLSFHVNQTYAPNRVLSLSTFTRERVRAAAPDPFAGSMPVQPPGRSTTPSTELVAWERHPFVQPHLELRVGSLCENNQSVTLDDCGRFVSRATGCFVAYLQRITHDITQDTVNFTIELADSRIYNIRLDIRGISGDESCQQT